ncbi:MAG: ThuA domain-containing protein [Chthoniobacteraceae bacterium]
MIYFLADDHYGMRPGAKLFEVLNDRYSFVFRENNLHCLTEPEFRKCQLLVLNLIAGTGGAVLPGAAIEHPLRAYIETARPLLLLHGASAAFWHWDWWRSIVGYRWVRNEDPDSFPASTHPTRPYQVKIAKCRHPLCKKLSPLDLPEDEIYIHLEQTTAAMTLLETTTDEGTFPQAWETMTPWGGRIIGFLPGHRREVVTHPDVVANVSTLIDYLLTPQR